MLVVLQLYIFLSSVPRCLAIHKFVHMHNPELCKLFHSVNTDLCAIEISLSLLHISFVHAHDK